MRLLRSFGLPLATAFLLDRRAALVAFLETLGPAKKPPAGAPEVAERAGR